MAYPLSATVTPKRIISHNTSDDNCDTKQVSVPCPACTNCTVDCAENTLSIRAIS